MQLRQFKSLLSLFSDSDSPKINLSVIYLRQKVTYFLIGTFEPIWGHVLNGFFPNYHDPIIYRIGISIISFMGLFLLIKKAGQWSYKTFLTLYSLSIISLNLHTLWVTANSGNDPYYVMGSLMVFILSHTLTFEEPIIFLVSGVISLFFLIVVNMQVESYFSSYFLLLVFFTSSMAMLTVLIYRSNIIFELFKLNAKMIKQSKIIDEERIKSFQASKLASLGEVASGIAHEINNPLFVIMTQCLLIRKKLELGDLNPQDTNKRLDKIFLTIDRIQKIILNLKRLTGNDQSVYKQRQVKVDNYLSDLLSFSHELTKMDKIEVVIDIDPNAPLVTIDENRIGQVVINVFQNAYEAVKNKPPSWINVSVKYSDDYFYIQISNSGEKIPLEIQEKMFDPYFSTKDIGKGPGLGLSVAKSLMRDLHGNLYFDNSSPHTTFVIQVPLNLLNV